MTNYKIFQNYLMTQAIPHKEIHEGAKYCILFKQNLNNSKEVIYQVIFKSDEIISVQSFSLINFEAAARAKVLEFLNVVNTRYSFPKFVLDHKGHVNLEWSAVIEKGKLVPEKLLRILIYIHQVLEAVYPDLLKIRWEANVTEYCQAFLENTKERAEKIVPVVSDKVE